MAKRKGPRAALGVITRPDGVRVEVKNPTTWRALEDQGSTLKLQAQVIDGLKDAIVRLEADRDRARGEALALRQAIEGSWWGYLGVRMGFIRIADSVTKVELRTVVANGQLASGTTPESVAS